MTRFILGFLTAFVLLVLVVGGAVELGLVPVATASKPLPFEQILAMTALHKAAAREMPKAVPIEASEENFEAGAKTYRVQCALCHGLPGQPQTATAKGEFPKPPELFGREGVTDDPPGETFWKVSNGIRLTGMPAFRPSLSDEQIWQVSLLLANADKLPGRVKNILETPLQIQ